MRLDRAENSINSYRRELDSLTLFGLKQYQKGERDIRNMVALLSYLRDLEPAMKDGLAEIASRIYQEVRKEEIRTGKTNPLLYKEFSL